MNFELYFLTGWSDLKETAPGERCQCLHSEHNLVRLTHRLQMTVDVRFSIRSEGMHFATSVLLPFSTWAGVTVSDIISEC